MINVPVVPRRIRPANFQPAPPPSAADTVRLRAFPRATLVIVVTLMLATAGLLIMLPRWAPSPGSATTPLRLTAPPTTITASAVAPPADEQATAIARTTAQILLRASLARVTQLQALHAQHWDRAGLHGVQEHINAGEKAYREQRFRAAQDAYRLALAQAAQVEARLPAVITALLQTGKTALEKGNSAQSTAAFDQVLAIYPDHPRATFGRARALILDRVQALIEQAEAYEQMSEHDQARVVYDDAKRLDPHTNRVAAGLARLDKIALAKRLGDALSQGHVALERGDFNAAGLAFKRAATLDGQSSEAQAGQRETARRATAASIVTQLDSATRAVRNESWREAVRHYSAALALDHELGTTRGGKLAAEQRAQLDTQLANLGQDMLALTDERQRVLAERVLTRAKGIAQAGPRLRGQIATLHTALRVAREAQQVTLLSDGKSEVSIDGIGKLGRFTTHTLKLTPGRYRANSHHDGQTDVRIEFTIAPGTAAPRITLQSAP